MSIELTPEDTEHLERDTARIAETASFRLYKAAPDLANALLRIIEAYDADTENNLKVWTAINQSREALKKAGITEAPEQSPYQ